MAYKTDLPNADLFAGQSKTTRREVTELVDNIVEAVEVLKAAEAQANEAKQALRELTKDVYWDTNLNAETPVHTFDARGRNNTVQVNFLNKYGLDQESLKRIKALLGQTPIMDNFQERSVVNMDVTDLDREGRVDFYKAIKELCDDYGVQGYVDEKYVVAPEFHDQRHTLIPAVNKAIDEVLPVQVHITT